MLNEISKRISFAHFSLALVGLMWVLPFLNHHHQYPLTTFDQEWWCAMLGVLSLPLLLSSEYWRAPTIPRIVQLPAALMLVVLLQASLGMMAYFGQALLYLLYLLYALLLMMLGARLRERFGLERLSFVLSVFLLAGAELSALIGLCQHFRWHTVFDSMIIVKVSTGVYGNLAQPNHFANYLALGLASIGLLHAQRKLPNWAVFLLTLPLLLLMTLSGSRSSWLYLLLMTLLAWRFRLLLRYCLLLLAGYVMMHGMVQLPFMKGAGDSYDVMQRIADSASGGIRLHLWYETWLIFKQSPWMGAGFGQFAWQHFQLGPVLRQTGVSGLYNNAHNLVFQIAAEAGMAGLAVLFAAIGLWSKGLRCARVESGSWWAYAVLGVLAIHSLLEYPLWYLYFLAIAAVLLGALDQTHYRLTSLGRMSMGAILLLGLLLLIQMNNGYRLLKETLAIRPTAGDVVQNFQRSKDGLVAVHGVPLLAPYADLFMSSYFDVSEDKLPVKLQVNANVLRFIPIAPVAYRQAFLLAQSGRSAESRQVLEQAIWSYPNNADAKQQLTKLAQKDPEHFAALLEFALKTEQEYVSAIHNK